MCACALECVCDVCVCFIVLRRRHLLYISHLSLSPLTPNPHLLPLLPHRTGGCVARIKPGETTPPALIQIQTRLTPLPAPENATNTSTSAFTGYQCDAPNPLVGGWNRLCPCLVNVNVTVSVPTPKPSAMPSLLAALNTIYIKGKKSTENTENRKLQLSCKCYFCSTADNIHHIHTTMHATTNTCVLAILSLCIIVPA